MTIVIKVPTSTNNADSHTVPYNEIEDETITVNSSTLADILSWDNREYARSIIQIENSDANSLDYAIYANVDSNGGVIPDFTTATWKEIKVPTALAATKTEVETLTDRYAWILIRMKETVATNSSVAKVHIRAFKS